jgi:hypothetical protein
MNYSFPLMEEEVKAYIIDHDYINLNDLDFRPGQIIKDYAEPIHTVTAFRQWYEPIEDEI